MRKSSFALAAILMVCGCMQPVGGGKSPAPNKRDQQSSGKLEQLAFESFQARDRVRAEKLRALKGLKYDVKRQEAIEAAGAEASRETWEPVAAELARRLDAVSSKDVPAFDAVIEELARGAERAGR